MLRFVETKIKKKIYAEKKPIQMWHSNVDNIVTTKLILII